MDKKAIAYETRFVHAIAHGSSISTIESLLFQIFESLCIDSFKLAWIGSQRKESIWLEQNYQFDFQTQTQIFHYENREIAIFYFNSTADFSSFSNLIQAIVIHCYLVLVRKERSERHLIKKDLEVASKMQQLLIPQDLYSNSSFSASGLYVPNYEVGGDFYDVIPINDYKIGFCIGDISGKGINAAIIMSHFIGFIRSTLMRNLKLEESIEIINDKMYELAGGEKFITLFLGIYNSMDKRLVYINSGHLPIPFFNQDEFDWLETGTTILGMFPKLPFIDLGKRYVTDKKQLFLYTDGLLNLNIDHEPFLSNRELNYILHSDCLEKSPSDITTYFREKIKGINVEDELKDDISVLAIELS